MNLIGKKVFISKLNNRKNVEGVITAVSDEYRCISVQFNQDSTGNHKYLLPDSFVKKSSIMAYLSTEDVELQDMVDSLLRKKKCAVCGREPKEFATIQNVRVCTNCRSQVVRCSDCRKPMLRKDARLGWDTYRLEECWICHECASSSYRKCMRCGKLVSKDKIIIDEKFDLPEPLCKTCHRQLTLMCDGCYELFPYDKLECVVKRENDGIFYCKSCKEKNVGICGNCGSHSYQLRDGLCVTCYHQKLYVDTFASDSFFKDKRIVEISGEKRELGKLKTTELMSRLNKSAETDHFDILIIRGYFYTREIRSDLVIVPSLTPGEHIVCNGSTFTLFRNQDYYKCNLLLRDELGTQNCRRTPLDSERTFCLLEKPFALGAKTYADMNHGDEWHGDTQVVYGNRWGDTSTFYIIGAIESYDKEAAKEIRILKEIMERYDRK